MAHNEFDPSALEYGGYHDDPDSQRANNSGYYGNFKEDLHQDLPANFAKEAARHQNFPDSENFEDESYSREGQGYETEEVSQQGNGSNPFGVDTTNNGISGGSFVDTDDRPIMGYNPFLNEEPRYEREGEEVEDGRCSGSQEAGDQFYGQGFGRLGETFGPEEDDERVVNPAYDQEGADEDEGDYHREKGVQRYHGEEATGRVDDTENRLYEQSEDVEQIQASPHQEHLYSEDTRAPQQDDMDVSRQPVDAVSDEHHFEDTSRDTLEDHGIYDTHEYPDTQAGDIDYEKLGIYEDEHRDDSENAPPQTGQVEDEDLGIVNQGFSDDGDLEAGRIIQEEEEVAVGEAAATRASNIIDTELYEEQRNERRNEQQYEDERVGDDDKQIIDNEERYINENNKEDEVEYAYSQEKDYRQEEEIEQSREEYVQEHGKFEEEEMDYDGQRKEDYTQEHASYDEEFGRVTQTKKDFSEEKLSDEDIIEQVSASVEEYTTQKLRSDDEDVERATSVQGEQFNKEHEEDFYTQISEQKQFSSGFPDLISTETEDRSFVDNVSEVTSPESIPQPLPSPPEPKNVSSFDPLAVDSTSPCQEPDLGQHGAGPENNTADFFTAGEVEGETRFGVDGTAVTSTTTQNNAFLHSEDEEEDEEDEESQHLDQAVTTETESVDERSGEYRGQGNEQMEGNDNALMSMSMEGSFYDDGGELIGGEDKRNQQDNNLFESGALTEESNQFDRFEQKQNEYGFSHDGFDQQVQNEFQQERESYQAHDDFDKDNDEDLERHRADTAPISSDVDGIDEDVKQDDFGSLVDVPETHTTAEEVGDSNVDNVGVDFIGEFESSVDSQPQQQVQEQVSLKDFEDLVQISDVTPEKPEEPASSVDDTPAGGGKEEPSTAAVPEAAAATAAGVAVAAAAAAAATTTKTTTTVKKSSAKAGGKTTTTTTTTTKAIKETKTANGKATSTKKAETTTTTSKTTTKKPDSRPTSTATTERKTSAKTTTSPTKPTSAAPASAKTTGPVPSYAQPITPRKPKETKVTEEKKKPAVSTATTTTTTRTSSATHRAPRPQSATTSSSTTTTTTATATKTATRTSVVTATKTSTLTARPKSSPTKLTNGTAATSTDTKTPTKKYGIDSKNEGYKPGGGSAKAAGEKKEVKATTKVDSGAKAATPGAAAAKSPTKTPTTPRTSTTPKISEVKSKIGSLDNASHTPSGGHVKIASKKPDFTNVTSKIGSKDKIDHKPGGGNVKIESKKVKVEAKSKIGSLNNAAHKPGGGDKKIEVQKTEWKAQSKIGSLDNVKHKPGGGDAQTESQKASQNESLDKGPGSGSEQGAAEVHNGAASEN